MRPIINGMDNVSFAPNERNKTIDSARSASLSRVKTVGFESAVDDTVGLVNPFR